MTLPVVLRNNFPLFRQNPLINPIVQPEQKFSLANIDIQPTDSYEVVYEPPYFSTSGIYEGEWRNSSSGVYSDNDPIKLFWVLTDGDAKFSININQGRISKRIKTIGIVSPQDDVLLNYRGMVRCEVPFCRWAIVCKYTCGKTIFKREMTLHLSSSEVSRTQHENVARQITELLNSKGYRGFDDIFR